MTLHSADSTINTTTMRVKSQQTLATTRIEQGICWFSRTVWENLLYFSYLSTSATRLQRKWITHAATPWSPEQRHYVKWWSHAHTVVWECCKDDRQSQWGNGKIWPSEAQPTRNPWTDRHQIWNTWLCREHLLPRKIRGQSAQGFLPPTYVKYTPKTFESLLLFFSVHPSPQRRARWTYFRA